MRFIALVLFCLACSCHGNRVQAGAPKRRTGGRVGGRAPPPRQSNPAPAPPSQVGTSPSVPSRSGDVHMHVHSGPGYGYGGGGIGVGTYVGLSLFETLIHEQRRQAYLQQQLQIQMKLGEDEAKIKQLQEELKEQNAKVDGLSKDAANDPDAADGGDKKTNKKLHKQIEKQQAEIEKLELKKKVEEQQAEIERLKR